MLEHRLTFGVRDHLVRSKEEILYEIPNMSTITALSVASSAVMHRQFYVEIQAQ